MREFLKVNWNSDKLTASKKQDAKKIPVFLDCSGILYFFMIVWIR